MGNVSKRQKIAFTAGILIIAAIAVGGRHEWKLPSVRRPPPKPHAVQLSWAASPSPSTTGYNVYRTYASRVGYVRLNSSPVKERSYVDSTISQGRTYFYSVTTVDSADNESDYSKEIRMDVP